MKQHPSVFRPAQPQAESAQQSLDSAAQLLEKKGPKARAQAQDAARQLQQLGQTLQEKAQERQLADAYKLKQMLDRKIAQFAQCQNAAPADVPSDAEMQQAAGETRQTLKQLKAVAEQPPTRDEFDPALRESLTDLKMLSLHWPLSDLEKAQPPEARQKAAGQVKEGLEEISQAFEKSQPQALRAAREPSSSPSPGTEWERGLAQLESLIRQLQSQRPISPETQLKQGQEALHHLQSAWNEKDAGAESGQATLARLQEALQPGENPLDLELLKQLRDALQASSAERVVPTEQQKPDQPDMTALDPTRLPPAYRGRIEKYFRKLSEK